MNAVITLLAMAFSFLAGGATVVILGIDAIQGAFANFQSIFQGIYGA